MTTRDVSRYPDTVHEFDGVDAFLAAPVPPGIVTIDYGGYPLDILNRPSGAATTLVVFHTALSARMTTLPVFSGVSMAEGLDVNLVCVSDPTLARDPDLTLAWFLGNADQPVQRDLPAVLRHVVGSHGSDHLIFFGASGGGFASLYFSQQFAGSLAVPVNPQITIATYDDGATLAYGRSAFGASTLSGARAVLNDRVTGDLRHLYRGGFHNTVAYVQNTMDTLHLYRQLSHFLAAVPRSPRMNVLLRDWGRGHVPPPKEAISAVLRGVVDAGGEWDRALAAMGFVAAPDPSFPVDVREGRATPPASTPGCGAS
jgi:hypothetical protein